MAMPDQNIQQQVANDVAPAQIPPLLTVLAKHFLDPNTCGLKMDLLKANFRYVKNSIHSILIEDDYCLNSTDSTSWLWSCASQATSPT
jgi:hypothetical protein